MDRLLGSTDLNELYVGDAEEESLYTSLSQEDIFPERQYYVRGTNAYYLTDLAVFCTKRNVQIDLDAPRKVSGLALNRSHETIPPAGWSALRLSRYEISHRPDEALRRVTQIVDEAGGAVSSEITPIPS